MDLSKLFLKMLWNPNGCVRMCHFILIKQNGQCSSSSERLSDNEAIWLVLSAISALKKFFIHRQLNSHAVESFGKPRNLKFTWKWHKNPPESQWQVGTILLPHPRSLELKFPGDKIWLTYIEHGLDDFRVTLQRKFIAAMSFASTVSGFYVVADWYKTRCANMTVYHLTH